MNILIDGMDRCGKSTEINILRNILVKDCTHVLKYANVSIANDEENNKYMYLLNKEMFSILSTMKHSNFICDRCHISQYVYGRLYRNLSKIQADELFKLEPHDFNTYLIVIVDSSFDTLSKREDNESLSHGKKALYKREYLLFKEAFIKSTIKNKLFIDLASTENNFETFSNSHKKILAFLSEGLYDKN